MNYIKDTKHQLLRGVLMTNIADSILSISSSFDLQYNNNYSHQTWQDGNIKWGALFKMLHDFSIR